MNATDTPKTALEKFLTCCLTSFATVFSQALGSTWNVVLGREEEVNDNDRVRVAFAATRALAGRVDFFIGRSDALRLAQAFTGQDAVGEWNAESSEAVDELFRQVAGHWATGLGQHFGETSFQLCTNSQAIVGPQEIRIEAKNPEGALVPIFLHISPEMMQALEPAVPVHSTQAGTVEQSMLREGNLELLMGVELGATLRFGQRRMQLRDVLELNTGSVIELDRQVQEPVDLLLDGKMIAKGEVVIVDGSYGLRVTEVASQAARSEFLR